MQQSSAGYGQRQVAAGIVCSSSFIHMRETQSFTILSVLAAVPRCVYVYVRVLALDLR